MFKTNKKLLFLLIILLLFSSSVFGNSLTVHYLNVGQADSILIQLPTNQTMLIDAGNNTDGDLVVNYLKNQGITKIDFLIGTHPHEDHIGGLDNVINSFDIGKIYMPRATHTTQTYEDVLLAIRAKDKKIIIAKAAVNVLNESQLKAYFLSPAREDYNELNEWSAVLKLVYKQSSFLFTGDAEEINEFEILASSSRLPTADVLKIAHHGSHSSTSEAFLKAVSPKFAVISVGQDNNYGHPSPIVLNRLKEHNVQIFRTDLQGAIIATSDGDDITFNVEPAKVVNEKQINTSNIIISLVDLHDELVVIKNTGINKVVLSGWRLLSVKGNQDFYFPSGTILGSGEIIKVDTGPGAASGPGQLKWTGRYIWNNDGDPAELYDNSGKLVSNF